MPTNLPAEYYEAEERYRAATPPSERITTVEALISTVPKHNGVLYLLLALLHLTIVLDVAHRETVFA